MKKIPFNKLHANVRKKYNRAKTQLLMKSPFFGSLMLQCQHIFTSDVPTMGTDGRDLYFNPDFVKSLSHQELMGVMVHELCHKMFLHRIRAEHYKDADKQRMRWNVAADYALNPVVVEAGFSLPNDALLDDQYKGMTAEQIYDKLGENLPDDAEDHFVFEGQPLSNEEARQLEREVKLQVAAAATMTKDYGSLPGEIQKLIDENAKSRVDWKAALAAFIEENVFGDDDITFKRPDRRVMPHDLYLPTTEGHKVPPIAVVFDTSGSIYSFPEVVEQFVAEIKSIAEHLKPEAVHFICNDTQVQSHQLYEHADEIEFELKGGGGTDFQQCFEYLEELDEYKPAVVLVMTDLYFNFSNISSSYPVMWVTYGDANEEEVPFGQKLQIQ